MVFEGHARTPALVVSKKTKEKKKKKNWSTSSERDFEDETRRVERAKIEQRFDDKSIKGEDEQELYEGEREVVNEKEQKESGKKKRVGSQEELFFFFFLQVKVFVV